jgi:hypothetical protein
VVQLLVLVPVPAEVVVELVALKVVVQDHPVHIKVLRHYLERVPTLQALV